MANPPVGHDVQPIIRYVGRGVDVQDHVLDVGVGLQVKRWQKGIATKHGAYVIVTDGFPHTVQTHTDDPARSLGLTVPALQVERSEWTRSPLGREASMEAEIAMVVQRIVPLGRDPGWQVIPVCHCPAGEGAARVGHSVGEKPVAHVRNACAAECPLGLR